MPERPERVVLEPKEMELEMAVSHYVGAGI